jgi:hypothetical protein
MSLSRIQSDLIRVSGTSHRLMVRIWKRRSNMLVQMKLSVMMKLFVSVRTNLTVNHSQGHQVVFPNLLHLRRYEWHNLLECHSPTCAQYAKTRLRLVRELNPADPGFCHNDGVSLGGKSHEVLYIFVNSVSWCTVSWWWWWWYGLLSGQCPSMFLLPLSRWWKESVDSIWNILSVVSDIMIWYDRSHLF